MPLSRSKTVQSVERAISILKSFTLDEPELGVGELSRRVGLPKSTVFRLLNTLEAGGLIAQNPETGRYRLGVDLISLGNRVVVHADLKNVARPILRQMALELGETVNLTILDRRDAVNLDQFVSPGHMVLRVGWIGRRMPAHAVSSGKAILAFLPENELNRYLEEPLAPLTPNTITDPEVLRQELALVRQQGYATAFEELEEGLNAISVPLRDHAGEVIASASVSGPAYRLTKERIAEIAPRAIHYSHLISKEMGFSSS